MAYWLDRLAQAPDGLLFFLAVLAALHAYGPVRSRSPWWILTVAFLVPWSFRSVLVPLMVGQYLVLAVVAGVIIHRSAGPPEVPS